MKTKSHRHPLHRLTAQLGSSAIKVGPSPRYRPLKPSRFTMLERPSAAVISGAVLKLREASEGCQINLQCAFRTSARLTAGNACHHSRAMPAPCRSEIRCTWSRVLSTSRGHTNTAVKAPACMHGSERHIFPHATLSIMATSCDWHGRLVVGGAQAASPRDHSHQL